MYYCHTRYYVPEWGRWLNADDPAYLDFLNPSCINLFACCGNDPIRRVSSIGHGSANNYFDYSNSINVFAGLNVPQFSAVGLVKDAFISIGEVGSRIIWGLSKNGRSFLDFHYSAYSINGYAALDNLPSTSAKIFKNLGFGLMALDVLEAGYYSYQNGHSWGQGALNVGLTAGKNFLVYKASTCVATAVGTWAGAKLGATLGSAAGPVGFGIGAVVGALVGWVVDAFGDVIIDWVVGWFD